MIFRNRAGNGNGAGMNDERFSVYFALDGIHLDGLIGSAGLLRFDWPERKFFVKHYEGISAAHNPSLSPDGRLALLGNFSQQIVVIDVSNPDDMRMVARQSTMYFEQVTYRLRANTHHLWYPDSQRFLGAVGDNLYRFHVDRLKEPESLGPHRLENAHELRWDRSHRYVLMGDLGPERKDVRQIAVFDLEQQDPQKRSRTIKVQNNIWHCAVHPTKPIGYALTYSLVSDNDDYVNWSPGYVREYIYEIHLPDARITRVWSAGAEFPIHLNSDVEVTEDAIYVASGGNHSVVEIELPGFSGSRVLESRPAWHVRARSLPQRGRDLLGAFSRRPAVTNTHYILQTLQVTGGRAADGVYAARVSPGGNYLIVGNRGYNVVSVHERRTFKEVYSKLLPFRRDRFLASPHHELGRYGYHLGIHHSEVVAR
jgi:hypothetical protein